MKVTTLLPGAYIASIAREKNILLKKLNVVTSLTAITRKETINVYGHVNTNTVYCCRKGISVGHGEMYSQSGLC